MGFFKATLFISVALIFLTLRATAVNGNEEAVDKKAFLCYWGSWAFYRVEVDNPENRAPMFDDSHIDPFMCTHLIYSFAGLNNETHEMESLDPWLDFAPNNCLDCGNHDMIRKAVKLRDINPDLKVMIAVGGWGQGSARFSNMSATPETRQIFIDSIMDNWIEKFELDGLDMDWEYPGKRDGNPNIDKDNFVDLLKELRERFDEREAKTGKKLWLTAAVGAGIDTIDVAYNVTEMSKYLDFINIMAYDYKLYVEGEWEKIGHHSPLHSKPSEDEKNKELTVSASVQYFLDLGAPPEKLALGVGAYGKTYTMWNSSSYHFYDEVKSGGSRFGFSNESGTIFYHEICYYILNENGNKGWNYFFDNDYQVPYAHNGEIWMGYDDETSIVEKVDFAENLGLGGMMIWSLDQDDFLNWCGGWYKFPIAGTVRHRMDYHYERKIKSTS